MQYEKLVGKIVNLIIRNPRAAVSVLLFFMCLLLYSGVERLLTRSDVRDSEFRTELAEAQTRYDSLRVYSDRQKAESLNNERACYAARLNDKDEGTKQIKELSESWKSQKEELQKEVTTLRREVLKTRNLSRSIKDL